VNRIETFMIELADLMERHRVDITVLVSCQSYRGDTVDGIEFESEPDWNDGGEDHQYESFDMSSSIYYESIREDINNLNRE
jgi:hypothetical protein